MNKSELKALIHEAVEEVLNEDFAPLGVAQEGIPGMSDTKMEKYLKKHKGNKNAAFKDAWRDAISECGDPKRASMMVKEMWTAFENKRLNEALGMDQEEEHDETDMSNPEENKEVELAKKIKELAEELLSMHGVKDEPGTEDVPDEVGQTPKMSL